MEHNNRLNWQQRLGITAGHGRDSSGVQWNLVSASVCVCLSVNRRRPLWKRQTVATFEDDVPVTLRVITFPNCLYWKINWHNRLWMILYIWDILTGKMAETSETDIAKPLQIQPLYKHVFVFFIKQIMNYRGYICQSDDVDSGSILHSGKICTFKFYIFLIHQIMALYSNPTPLNNMFCWLSLH